MSDMASSAKAHANICKAKAEEKADKATARTEEEKEIAHQMRKAKEAEAMAELHAEKARHAAEKLEAKQAHHLHGAGVGIGRHHQPLVVGYNEPVATGVGGTHQPVVPTTTAPVLGATAPNCPLGSRRTPFWASVHVLAELLGLVVLLDITVSAGANVPSSPTSQLIIASPCSELPLYCFQLSSSLLLCWFAEVLNLSFHIEIVSNLIEIACW
ncbi:hypothetical protein Ancab_015720 [Ancistrocladus abbreviatus]